MRRRPRSGPVQYLADTPCGAWAGFIRHEEIADEVDLIGVGRALWVVDVDVSGTVMPKIPGPVATGDAGNYPACQDEAARIRKTSVRGIKAPSAALKGGGATGFRVENGYAEGPNATASRTSCSAGDRMPWVGRSCWTGDHQWKCPR